MEIVPRIILSLKWDLPITQLIQIQTRLLTVMLISVPKAATNMYVFMLYKTIRFQNKKKSKHAETYKNKKNVLRTCRPINQQMHLAWYLGRVAQVTQIYCPKLVSASGYRKAQRVFNATNLNIHCTALSTNCKRSKVAKHERS